MIAEKPSIAWDIYSALSGTKVVKEKGGNSILKFQSNFFHHQAQFTVSSVKGHVF